MKLLLLRLNCIENILIEVILKFPYSFNYFLLLVVVAVVVEDDVDEGRVRIIAIHVPAIAIINATNAIIAKINLQFPILMIFIPL